jgi:hypothetical protein
MYRVPAVEFVNLTLDRLDACYLYFERTQIFPGTPVLVSGGIDISVEPPGRESGAL